MEWPASGKKKYKRKNGENRIIIFRQLHILIAGSRYYQHQLEQQTHRCFNAAKRQHRPSLQLFQLSFIIIIEYKCFLPFSFIKHIFGPFDDMSSAYMMPNLSCACET